MRRSLAALLVAVQLQPLWGLVLCLGVTMPAARSSMAHCADSEMPAPAAGAPVLDAPGAGQTAHGCPLADACTPSVIVALAQRLPPVRLTDRSILPLRSADAALGLARLAPPTPPPNL